MWRVFFTLMVVLVAGVKPAHAETIRFIPLPMQNRETVFGQFKPMTDYLEQRLKVKIVYDYCDSYADVLERFRQSQVDLAYLGPLPYVELRATFAHAEPIVRFCESSGRAEYTCALVSFMDNVFDPQSAHHRRIALTQPFSTCGYLSTSRLMHWMGSNIEQNLYRYLEKHDEVALAVIRGDFDAGGLKTAIARKYVHMGLDILAETMPLPGFALVGNTRTLAPQRIADIRDVLTALVPDGPDGALLQAWGNNIRHGTVPAADANYQTVREMIEDIQIPMKGNF